MLQKAPKGGGMYVEGLGDKCCVARIEVVGIFPIWELPRKVEGKPR
jgi:hypothetical protein